MKLLFLSVIFVIMASTYIDYGITYSALQTGRYAEGNPITKWFVNRPYIAIPIITFTNAGFGLVSEGLYKDSKTMAWIVAGLLIILKGYVLWHNIHLLRRY